MKKIYKILSILVVASILVTLIPLNTFAEDIPTVITRNGSVIYANGIPILIKEVEEDGVKNTYVYDSTGTTRLDIYDGKGTVKQESAVITGLSVYGGTELPGDVASTSIVIESGRVASVFGGGKAGNVLGDTYVTIKAGSTASTIYGGGATGNVGGNTNVECYKTANIPSRVAGGCVSSGTVEGNANIILHEPNNPTALYGGSGGVGDVNGNVNITVNGGKVANVFGGCASTGIVKNWVNINITGDAVVGETAFQATGKNYVVGGAKIYVPDGFSTKALDNIIAADRSQKQGGKVIIYQNGSKIYPTVSVTYDEANKIAYANGLPVIVKIWEEDGNTYIFDALGAEKLLPFPVDGYKIFGGSAADDEENTAVFNTSITMESGRVAALYAGGNAGTVSGNAFVHLNGGVANSVYARGITGTIIGLTSVSVSESASVTESIYSDSSNASLIRLPSGFSPDNVIRSSSSRIFIGNAELPDTSIPVPQEVTKSYVNKENSIFANGIPIVVKKDASDGRTYVYDAAGTTRLLTDEVNGYAIYGGSEKGIVESTHVTMESGTVARIYGGGYYSCVSGLSRITITGGDITEGVHGGSYNGDVGGTNIFVNGPCVAKNITGGSRNGTVLGNVDMLLINSVAKGIYGGTGVTSTADRIGCPGSDVLGNVSITMEGGSVEAIYGGCRNSTDVVKGTSTMTFKGQTVIKAAGILPQSNGGVVGGAYVYIPQNFVYKDSITRGAGITVVETENAEPVVKPERTAQTEKVMSKEGDSGKLVYRFIDIPELSDLLMSRPGEAIFITFPNGQNMLIDAGADTESCKNLLFDFLDRMGVTHIDFAVATHYHADHVGSMAEIFNRPSITVGKLFTTGFKVPTGTLYNKNLGDWITANPDKVEYLWRNQTFNIGDVQIEVLNPLESDAIKATMNGSPSTDDYNNNSIVLKITYGAHTSLMTADMYIAAEKQLLAAYKDTPGKLKADLIKVPHHGDTTSSDPEFVRAVSPDIAVLTHFLDTPIVNNRYMEVGADTYVTGMDGIVKLVYDGKNEAPRITPEYYVAKPALEVEGGADIIYVDNAKESVTSYTYKLYDQYGNVVNSEKLVRTLTDDNGNLINDTTITFENDTLTVKGKPQAAYVVVNYVYGDLKVSKRTVFKAVPTEDDDDYSPPAAPSEATPGSGAGSVDTKAPTFTVSRSSVEAALKNNANPVFEIILDPKTTDNVVKLTADSFKALAGKNFDIAVKTGTIDLSIPASAIDIAALEKTLKTSAENINIEIKISEAAKNRIVLPEGTPLNLSDKVYSFSIAASNGAAIVSIDSFGKYEAVGTLPVPEELKGENEARINVYHYNEASKALELRPTRVVDGKIVFKTSSFSLYAVMLNTIAFEDVKTHWAEKYVHTLAAKSIINGKGEKAFDPEGKMTRAEFASIIARAFGLSGGSKAEFTDVREDTWYAEAINAAYSAGLIRGKGDGTFAPEALISREEMAVIALRAYRFAKGLEAASGTTAAFDDTKEISGWAAADVLQAYGLGIVKGSNNTFAPGSDMTRAEGATVLYNLLVKLGIL